MKVLIKSEIATEWSLLTYWKERWICLEKSWFAGRKFWILQEDTGNWCRKQLISWDNSSFQQNGAGSRDGALLWTGTVWFPLYSPSSWSGCNCDATWAFPVLSDNSRFNHHSAKSPYLAEWPKTDVTAVNLWPPLLRAECLNSGVGNKTKQEFDSQQPFFYVRIVHKYQYGCKSWSAIATSNLGSFGIRILNYLSLVFDYKTVLSLLASYLPFLSKLTQENIYVSYANGNYLVEYEHYCLIHVFQCPPKKAIALFIFHLRLKIKHKQKWTCFPELELFLRRFWLQRWKQDFKYLHCKCLYLVFDQKREKI